ncbi:hypothetical protein [Dactylosporangium sp. NPDC006015]|uniref:hypothetical protein n=1 Tax=Dactylosporangium sp. NPDC006015 TaxID=3154576 RepID=UPI0033B2E9BB
MSDVMIAGRYVMSGIRPDIHNGRLRQLRADIRVEIDRTFDETAGQAPEIRPDMTSTVANVDRTDVRPPLGGRMSGRPVRGIVRIEVQGQEALIHSPIWAKDALRAGGARWDPDRCMWTVENLGLTGVVEALKGAGFVLHIDHASDTAWVRRRKRQQAIETMRTTKANLMRQLLEATPLPLILVGGMLIEAGAGVVR